MRKVRTFHQLPVEFAGDKAEQEFPLVSGQCGGQFCFQSAPNCFQLCERDRITGHAYEFIFKGCGHILISGKQDLTHWTIVTSVITDKTRDHLHCESAALEERASIKQVKRCRRSIAATSLLP